MKWEGCPDETGSDCHHLHYSTAALQHCSLPEEYISRLFGTFDQWTHVSCNFNFERVPLNFTETFWDMHKFGMMEQKVIAGHLFCTSLLAE